MLNFPGAPGQAALLETLPIPSWLPFSFKTHQQRPTEALWMPPLPAYFCSGFRTGSGWSFSPPLHGDQRSRGKSGWVSVQ